MPGSILGTLPPPSAQPQPTQRQLASSGTRANSGPTHAVCFREALRGDCDRGIDCSFSHDPEVMLGFLRAKLREQSRAVAAAESAALAEWRAHSAAVASVAAAAALGAAHQPRAGAQDAVPPPPLVEVRRSRSLRIGNCAKCRTLLTEDNSDFCELCDEIYCVGCMHGCNDGKARKVCSRCAHMQCGVCAAPLCASCKRATCNDCGDTFCQACYAPSAGECPACAALSERFQVAVVLDVSAKASFNTGPLSPSVVDGRDGFFQSL